MYDIYTQNYIRHDTVVSMLQLMIRSPVPVMRHRLSIVERTPFDLFCEILRLVPTITSFSFDDEVSLVNMFFELGMLFDTISLCVTSESLGGVEIVKRNELSMPITSLKFGRI